MSAIAELNLSGRVISPHCEQSGYQTLVTDYRAQ